MQKIKAFFVSLPARWTKSKRVNKVRFIIALIILIGFGYAYFNSLTAPRINSSPNSLPSPTISQTPNPSSSSNPTDSPSLTPTPSASPTNTATPEPTETMRPPRVTTPLPAVRNDNLLLLATNGISSWLAKPLGQNASDRQELMGNFFAPSSEVYQFFPNFTPLSTSGGIKDFTSQVQILEAKLNVTDPKNPLVTIEVNVTGSYTQNNQNLTFTVRKTLNCFFTTRNNEWYIDKVEGI